MIGIFLLYFIGKSFYQVKEQSKKGRWMFVAMGIACYYFGAFAGAFLLGLIFEITGILSFDSIPERGWDLIAVPFGILSCWQLYKYLERQQSKTSTSDSSEVLDGDLIK